MPITRSIASCLKPYITINGLVPGQTYRYAAREKNGEPPNFRPVVDCTMHRPKYRQHSIVYMAIKSGADLSRLQPGDKLYVGSQSGPDRMFRGDGLSKALNFHHAEMRDGRNRSGMERYLEQGGKVDIYLAEAPDLRELATATLSFASLSRLLAGETPLKHPIQIKHKDHVGYWFEQLILRDEHQEWAWNIKGIDASAAAVFKSAGVL